MVRTHTPQPESADAHDAGQSPAPDADRVYRLVGDLVRFFCPAARDVCITYRVPGQAEPGRIPVPTAATAEDVRDEVVNLLARLRPGEYMKGRAVAAELDMEYEGGHFRAMMAKLAKDEVIESHTQKGYRLPVA